MEKYRTKIRWTLGYCKRILAELFIDLFRYYFTPYPFLLLLGAFRRIRRRFKIIWLPKPKGRPPVHENVVDLIIEMKRCNLIWGAQRISDELKIMGIFVSKKTVLKILKQNGFIPPKMKFIPPPWQNMLSAFARHWAMDLTCTFDSMGQQLFIFSIIEVPSRVLVLINSTTNPDKDWIIQQLRNTCIQGYDFPSAVVHDRDGIYGNWLPKILLEFGSKSVKTEPRCPWQNAHIERFNGTLKREILNRIYLIDNAHVQDLCISYQKYYNQKRPHQGIDGMVPEISFIKTRSKANFDEIKVRKSEEVEGLITCFALAA